jgi:hypothetical protein
MKRKDVEEEVIYIRIEAEEGGKEEEEQKDEYDTRSE